MHNPVADHLGYRLRRASVAMISRISRTAEARGLSLTLSTVLILIRANPGCRQRDLCAELGIKRANMAPIIAALDLRGLVDRSAIDGRSQAMLLTDAGAALADELLDALRAAEAEVAAQFGGDGVAQLSALAWKLERQLAEGN